MKLHRYRATIRGSKLPLFQMYFAVSLLPFGASHQPKYVSFYCCSDLLVAKFYSFLYHEKVSFSLSSFVETAFKRSIIAEAYCQILY